MTIRTILVCLTQTQSAARLLESAAILARRDNAHLIGLYVSESLVVYPGIAMHVPESSYIAFAENQKSHAKEIRKIFEAEMAGETFPSEWRQLRSGNDTIADRIVESARSADLVVMAQEEDSYDRMQVSHLQERVIRDGGRPVLVIPRDYTAEKLGEAVVLGWSATREATRAAHDLFDVVAPGARVRILRIGKSNADELADHSANDLAAAYDRHGLDVDVVHRDKDGHRIPDILNQDAFEMGADMLVTGAFGHSRSYDFVIGAATRLLLNDAKLPVLFSK